MERKSVWLCAGRRQKWQGMRLQGGACGVVAPHRLLEQKYKHRLGTCSLETQAIRPSPDRLNREVWGSGPSRQRFWFTSDLQDRSSSAVQYRSTSQNGERAESSYCQPPHRALRALLTAVPRLRVLSPRLVYFQPRVWTPRLSSPTSSIAYLPPLWQPPLDSAVIVSALLLLLTRSVFMLCT